MRATIRTDGRQHAVEVDGKDVSRSVCSATVFLDAGRPVEAMLELSLPVIEVLGAEASVQVSDDVHTLLVNAGWTPPSEV